MKKTLAMILVLCMALTLVAPAFAEGKSPVKAVAFDLDDTLYSEKEYVRSVSEKLLIVKE